MCNIVLLSMNKSVTSSIILCVPTETIMDMSMDMNMDITEEKELLDCFSTCFLVERMKRITKPMYRNITARKYQRKRANMFQNINVPLFLRKSVTKNAKMCFGARYIFLGV